MIVLDPSTVVDLLIKPAAETSHLRARIRRARIVYAPHLMDAEVSNTLGRYLLRDQLSAYDAIDVAMAEVTGATLLTRDARLARAAGHRARIEVF